MHPVYAKQNFGVHGVLVRYYNGTSVVNGYITKQTGTNRFNVTDGTNPKTSLTLAQTAAQVTNLGSTQPSIFTIPVSSFVTTASGATFVASYGVDSTTTSIVSGGLGWSGSDAIVVAGGGRATGTVTIAILPQVNDTLNLGGTTITFVASGATGNQVNIAGTAALTASALYTFLIGSADANLVKCWYSYLPAAGTVITIVSRTSGTTNNAFVMTPTSGGRIQASSATLLGGSADATGTPPTITAATVGTGAVLTLTISAVGALTTLPPSSSIFGYFAGNAHTPVALTVKYKLVTLTGSGGTGYVVNQTLNFQGMVSLSDPLAHISVVSSGAVSTLVIDNAGTGIVSTGTPVLLGPVEHVKAIYDTAVQTVEGNRYGWTVAVSSDNSAVINNYS